MEHIISFIHRLIMISFAPLSLLKLHFACMDERALDVVTEAIIAVTGSAAHQASLYTITSAVF